MDDQLDKAALEYHRFPQPGKIAVMPTKAMTNQRDLALAYSPGVAVPCMEIHRNPLAAYDYTSKGNLVAVVSNGTAVLGLGNIGALAGKPVMEGKGCLFRKFAGIDVFDIEVDETDPAKLVEIVAALEPTFGGINLEDIKAPECFVVEQALRRRMRIPSSTTTSTAPRSSRRRRCSTGSRWSASGSGRQARLLGRRRRRHRLPQPRRRPGRAQGEHLGHRQQGRRLPGPPRVHGRPEGPVRPGHPGPDARRHHRGAGRVLRPLGRGRAQARDGAAMADRPIILAMANPDPEIRPELAKEARPDCIIATGAATTRTRSTTSCASRSSSAARSTWAPPRSTRR
jgi:malate dehydrogenase (oxaloacetate-decarboxylating)(NADP+)